MWGDEGEAGATQLFFVPFWDYTAAMKIVAVRNLKAFWEKHPDAEQHLKAWADEATLPACSAVSSLSVRIASGQAR